MNNNNFIVSIKPKANTNDKVLHYMGFQEDLKEVIAKGTLSYLKDLESNASQSIYTIENYSEEEMSKIYEKCANWEEPISLPIEDLTELIDFGVYMLIE